MPQKQTHPGVYIQEGPSERPPITAVPTAITAFVGRCPRGAVNEPLLIRNWGEFDRFCGGLSADYPLSYAVRDFFANGGQEALIVRLFKGTTTTAATPQPSGRATLSHGNLRLAAANPGQWGNLLQARVNHRDISAALLEAPEADKAGLTVGQFFNLTLLDTTRPLAEERFSGVSLHPASGPRRLDRVLREGSALARVAGQLPAAEDAQRPRATTGAAPLPFEDGADSAPLATAEAYSGSAEQNTGLHALRKAAFVNLVCIPPDVHGGDTPPAVYQAALALCVELRAMLIVDPPAAWAANKARAAAAAVAGLADLGLTGSAARNAALYFPRLRQDDPLREKKGIFVPCGAVAGVIARTDAQRGVWTAPAGPTALINGVAGMEIALNDVENGSLNAAAINSLRAFPNRGSVVWGARTLRGADPLGDDFRYVPVRRLALFIEESLYRGLQWAVFEPNSEALWAQLRQAVETFLQDLFARGAFQGATADDAYFARCDAITTKAADIARGRVNVAIGFAPLKPAEFILLQLALPAGQPADQGVSANALSSGPTTPA